MRQNIKINEDHQGTTTDVKIELLFLLGSLKNIRGGDQKHIMLSTG